MSEYPTYLIHYGIQGQKWGVRRFQNEDGTWTDEGLRRRKLDDQKSFYKEVKKDVQKGTFDPKKYKTNAFVKDQIQKTNIKRLIKDRDEFNKEYKKLEKNEKKRDEIYSLKNAPGEQLIFVFYLGFIPRKKTGVNGWQKLYKNYTKTKPFMT